MSEIAQIILAVKNIFKAGFVAREDFLLPALIVLLCLALIFFFFRLRRLQPRTSSSLLIVLTCALLSLGVFYNHTRELETAGLSCGDEKSCLSSLERRGSVAGEETTGNFSAIGGSASGGQSNSNDLILSKIIFTPVISGDGTVKYKTGDLQIKSNGLVRIITGAVGSREIKNGSIQDADIDDDINLTVETIYSRGTMEAGGDLIIGGNTIVTNGQINVGDKVITQGDIGVGISVPLAKLHVHQTSPSGNEVLFLISTGDDSSRFSVDEDGDFTADGNLVLGGTIDTGMGATEVYLMNQNLRTTDAPIFATLNTGQGAYELYAMDQNVLAASSPIFAGLTLNGTLTMGNNGIDGTNYDISATGIITGATWNGAVIADGYIANDITLANLTQITSRSHSDLQNLLADDHTQYALLAGRSGGQILIGDTAASGNLTLQSTSHATKGKILFGTSAYDEVNNRLGIGTTSPGAKLEIVPDTGGVGLLINNTNNYEIKFAGSQAANIYQSAANQSMFFLTAAGTGTINFGTNATAGAMVINSTGNVGIGTASPSGKLSVAGASTDNAHFFYDNDDVGDANTGQSLYVYRRAAEGDNYLRMYINEYRTPIFQANEDLRITAWGVSLYDYNANMSLKHYGLITGQGMKYIQWKVNDTTDNFELTRQDSNIGYFDIQMPTIFTSGNVGIGTTSPAEALTIAGGNILLDNNQRIKFKDSGGTARDFFVLSGSNVQSIGGSGSTLSDTYLQAGNAAQAMVIKATTGNVGIGITAPTSRIHGETTLSAATGNEIAYQLNYTTNKATSGNDTGLLINMTDTLSPGTSYLIDAQVGGASKFSVDNNGNIRLNRAIMFADTYGIQSASNNQTLYVQIKDYTSADNAIEMVRSTFSNTSGSSASVVIMPTYNQTSGTAANTDLLINRTQTAVGSGAQLLIDAQVGGTSMWNLSNTGLVTNIGGNDFATAATKTYYSTIKSSAAEGLAGEDLRIGLDESNRTIIIADRGDIGTDFGLGAATNPTLRIYSAAAGAAMTITSASIKGSDLGQIDFAASGTTNPQVGFYYGADTTAATVFSFTQAATTRELTASAINQNFVSMTPEILQTGTASYTGLLVNPTESSLGSGQSYLMDLQVGSVSKFNVSNAGLITQRNLTGPGLVATSTLDDATGNEIAYQLNYTTNKATSGNDTGLLINMTDTLSPGTSYLLDLQKDGVSKFKARNDGILFANGIYSATSGAAFVLAGKYEDLNVASNGITASAVTWTPTSGQVNAFAITPTYNETSGTAANTDLLINRTQTAVGSGAQLLIDAQVGGTSMWNLSNTGLVTNIGGNDFATAATKTYYHTIKSSAAEGLAGEDLRIGLDESNRTLIIADRGDIGTDFGLVAQTLPTIYIFNATASNRMAITNSTLTTNNYPITLQGADGVNFKYGTDNVNATVFSFTQSSSAVELTASAINQAFVSMTPEILQTGTASYTGLLVNPTESSLGSGQSYLLDLQVGGVSKFSIDNLGNINNPGSFQQNIAIGSGQSLYLYGTGMINNANATLLLQPTSFAVSDNAIEMAYGTFSGAGVAQNAVVIKPTWNQSTTSSGTDLLINRTQTAVGSGAQLLIDAQVGGVSKFKVDNGGRVDITGLIYAGGGFAGSTLFSSPSTNTFSIYGRTNNTTAGDAITLVTSVAPWTNTSGQSNAVKIIPTYNQTSGTAANTDLLISRTQTAVGSGAQYLIDAQVGGVSKFSVSNTGVISGIADPLTQYALLAGRAGGQTLIGGSAASETLTLQSTSNATKGKILFGTSAYDEVNNRLGIGTTSPGYKFVVAGGDVAVGYSGQGTNPVLHIYGSGTSGAAERLLYMNGTTGVWHNGHGKFLMEPAGMLSISPWNAVDNAYIEQARFGQSGGLAIGRNYIATTPPSQGMIIEGNVGIGTTSPGTLLDLKQNVNTNVGGLRIVDTTGNNSIRLWIDASGVQRIDNGNDASGRISLNGAGTGNVGIGTTSPGNQLTQKSTAALESATLGSELLSGSGWTSTDWTGDWATGFDHTAGNTTALTNTLAATNGWYYKIDFTVTGRTAGSFTITFGGVTSLVQSVTAFWGPRAISTGTLSIAPSTDFDGAIIISIKRITGTYAATYAIQDSAGTNTFEVRNNLNAWHNNFIGLSAGSFNIGGINNNVLGFNAFTSNTTGSNNNAFGYVSMASNNTGHSNSAFGSYTLFSNTVGYNNTALGSDTLYSNTVGNYNTAVGSLSLRSNTTGVGNTALGYLAGRYNTDASANATGGNSVFLGYDTRANADGQTNQIVIGYQAIGLGSNTVVLGNSSIATTVLRGNVGIGTTSPVAKAEITGGTITDTFSALKVTGTTATTYSGNVVGALIDITTAGNQSVAGQDIFGTWVKLEAGYTGSNATTAFSATNYAAGTGNTILKSGSPTGNIGMSFAVPNTSTGANLGVAGFSRYGDLSIGGVFRAGYSYDSNNKTGATYIGAMGLARNDTGANSKNIGGYFGLNYLNPTYESAALIADNADTLVPIFLGRDNGSTVFSIIDGGNVGIGTTSPGAKLHIQDISGQTQIGGSTALTIGGKQTASVVGERLELNFKTYNGFLKSTATIGVITTNITDYETGDLYFAVKNGTNNIYPSEVMRITNTGNVGIGTTSPTNILSLGNTTAQKFWIENSATDVVGSALTVAAGGTVAGTSVADRLGGNLILQSGLGTGTGASTISFQTGTTLTTGLTLQTMSTKMTILGNGNVGIGTASPGSPLHIQKSAGGTGIISLITLDPNSSTLGDGTAIDFLDTSDHSTIGARIASTREAVGGYGDFRFYTQDAGGLVEKVRIKNNGNVGIGTTSPGYALDVNGIVNSNAYRLNVTGLGSRSGLWTSGTILGIGSSDYTQMDFYTDATPAVTIKDGGNVGIGTTSPTRSLDIGYGHLGFITVVKPTAPSLALAGVAGNVDNGAHSYTVTYYTTDGETDMGAGTAITVTDKTTNGQVTVTIPVSTNTKVTGRKIYRTLAGTSNGFYLLTTIANNTAVTYTDNTADSSLPGAAFNYAYTTNSTAGKFYLDSTQTAFFGNTTTLLGKNAGNSQNNIAWNAAVGSYALGALTTGIRNTAFGDRAGQAMNSGGNNIFVGQEAGYYATTGSNNTMVGTGIFSANSGTTTYSGITAIGANIGNEDTSPTERIAYVGTNSTFLGYNSGPTVTTITNSTAIGHSAKVTASNQVVIGNSSVTETLLRGNVGIGTTGPDNKLDITLEDAATNTIAYPLKISHITTGTAAENFGTGLQFNSEDSSGNEEGVGRITAYHVTHNTAKMDFQTIYGNETWVTAMTIDNGKVGIGTASPGYKLDVVGNVRATSSASLTSPILTFIGGTGLSTESAVIGTQGRALFGYDGARGAVILSDQTANKPIVFDTNSLERMRILAGGNVGIGTTDPTSRIHGVTTLSAATGDEIAYRLDYTTNKATSGNDTGLLINMTDTLSPGTSYLLDLQVGGVSKFRVNNVGNVIVASFLQASGIYSSNGVFASDSNNATMKLQENSFTVSDNAIEMAYGTFSGAGVTQNAVVIMPTYNQTTTSSATDLLINRTQTAVGSGAQLLIDAQVGGVSKFSVSNTGSTIATSVYASNYGGNSAGVLNFTPYYGSDTSTTTAALNAFIFNGTALKNQRTGGQQNMVSILPLYNQTSGTAANTDLLINRTQTAVGSGAQLLIDAQVGGVSQFSVSNAGAATIAGTVTLSSVGAMDANDTYVCRDPTSGVLTTGATCTASSQRYKKNIADMSGGLNTVMQLRPVTFDWKYNNRPGLGFIAEEVEQINPVLVTYDDEGNVSGLHYDWMSAILTKAVQELASSASEQQAAIAEISNSEFLISNQIPNLNDQVSGLVLKTGENISTIKELQESVDEELAKISNSSSILADRQILISNKIQNINDQNTDINEILKQVQYDNIAQDNLIAALQAQMDELKKLANQELNLAQIEANKTDIEYLKLLLGTDRAENGNINLLGKLEADGIVAGAFMVKVIDEEKKTIGEDIIPAGETSIIIKTKAVSKDSKIFITISRADKAVPIKTGNIKEGESFKVEINDPAASEVEFDWWIIEKKKID